MSEAANDTAKFQIFRAADAPGLMETSCMTVEPFTPDQRAGMDKVLQAGYLEGDTVKVLCNVPGFSLTHVWFKKGYPLPLHSHDAESAATPQKDLPPPARREISPQPARTAWPRPALARRARHPPASAR